MLSNERVCNWTRCHCLRGVVGGSAVRAMRKVEKAYRKNHGKLLEKRNVANDELTKINKAVKLAVDKSHKPPTQKERAEVIKLLTVKNEIVARVDSFTSKANTLANKIKAISDFHDNIEDFGNAKQIAKVTEEITANVQEMSMVFTSEQESMSKLQDANAAIDGSRELTGDEETHMDDAASEADRIFAVGIYNAMPDVGIPSRHLQTIEQNEAVDMAVRNMFTIGGSHESTNIDDDDDDESDDDDSSNVHMMKATKHANGLAVDSDQYLM